MASTGSLPSIGSATLLNYFNAQITAQTVQQTAHASSNASASGTAAQTPPWNTPNKANDPARDAQVLTTTNFINLDASKLTGGTSSSDKTQADNEKLFALYKGVNQLYYLASMAQRAATTPGQLAGYDARFQAGLSQIKAFVNSTKFNDFTLQAGQTSASLTSAVSMPFANFAYTGATVVGDANIGKPLANVSASESFTVAVKKGGTITNVAIDLAQVQGGLTIDNIVAYTNQQLAAAGFSTRFTRTITQGTVNDPTKAFYGIAVTPASSETVALSSAAAAPALYIAGTTGSTTAATTTTTVNGTKTTTTTQPDNQGNLVKLTNLSGSPSGVFNTTAKPSSGTTTAQSTVVDSNGNAYVIGNATGNFGNELNQGTQDVYLSKYDSTGNLLWSKLLGSAGSAAGYSLALNPTGGVVVAGSTTADLSTTAVANGNTDSFAAKYDAEGNQTWVTQLQTLSNNQPASVSVDASGNVYVGGQVTGVIGAGQTSAGGTDGYVAKLDANGKVVYEKQLGTAGKDVVAATATTADGGLVVASTENGEAFLTKYANGDATSTPAWRIDLGNLQNGALGGLAVSGNQIYLSGSTANAALTAGGQASVANASSGATDAFVFKVTDAGTSATPNFVSYVGNGGQEKGNAVTVGPDGTVYLAGSTTGTFAGQTRNVANVNNAFVAALSASGAVGWTRQYGGADGQSTAQGIAVDPAGASVLDALGLPRGALDINQSVDLASQTTLRPGDSFKLNIQGAAARNTTITIEKGETLQTLVGKINDALLFNGKASVAYGSGGGALKIAVNPGASATLVAGPADFDALARLGIPAGALTAPAKSTSSTANTSATPATKVFGLGLTGTLGIATASGAGAAHAVLANVLSAIRNVYQAINAPPASAAAPQSTGPVPAYLQARVANYKLALSFLGGGGSSTVA